ncbi:MAG TPA: hypothetical protein VIY08_03275 [Candidatus Nitrosocosmicus sp.]
MTELTLIDYFIMGEAVGIITTFIVSLYYSRKQMQKLSTEIDNESNDKNTLTVYDLKNSFQPTPIKK